MLIQYLPTTGNRPLDDWAARICRQLEIVAGDVSDVIYGAGWNGVTTIAPSKNTIYDKIELLISDIELRISNIAYAASWNGVTTIAPSKNAVYDKIELLVSDIIYGAGWDGVTTIAPSKNAVYDKIEALKSSYVKVSDVKASGTDGGTFTLGAWRTRVLNTEDSDTDGICSLASNQITLSAGTYICSISAPAYNVGHHQLILYNVTGTTTLLVGSVTMSGSSEVTHSFVVGKFIVAAGQALAVRHRCEVTNVGDGLGTRGAFGVGEVYAVAEFWKVV